jgi:tetratricopeptide (TPR) repeat protein
MLARAGEYQSAIAFLEPLVDPAAPDNTYFSPAPELYGLHALAWAYLHAGADDKAARLLESAARWCDQKRTAGPLRDGLMLHRCAETLLLQGNVDRALAEFDRAVAAGWRDFYVRQKDPYWVMVQDRPAYRALIDKVQADIARQRTEVARVDSGDAFAETLTAARAERMRTSK